MNQHQLKTYPKHLRDIVIGLKTVEIRKNDRKFKIGDTLMLKEYKPKKKSYGKNWCEARVRHIFKGEKFGIKKGYISMSIVVFRKGVRN